MAHEYLIIGAGPAGLPLAALPARGGRDHAVLEKHRDLPEAHQQPLVAFVEECLAGA
ncbi:FAD-dependent monooxygenase [Lentzea jiangxiensis]|uniref:FAD binding domain-containing protein n=1 Tax=Lentzea jiangxiensis TaxID=641025 RepID=A0A1H0WAL1_9PSEU|nr:FAD-dependent monooxygenase [Lentzea jiangxiensis]SDP87581.1 FAD binding domain-containing protein [Lentzea jiangxiensis]